MDEASRLNSAHTLVWYLAKKTSPKYPAWRDAVISFFYNLHEVASQNYALSLDLKRVDGLYVFHNDNMAFYLQIYQQHALLHLKQECLMWRWPKLNQFTPHKGSWAEMYKIRDPRELNSLVSFTSTLPKTSRAAYYASSRTIPVQVQRIVWDRDKGRCRSCGSTEELHFDHIIPFSKNGTSKDDKNVQILCAKCNLRKGNRMFL